MPRTQEDSPTSQQIRELTKRAKRARPMFSRELELCQQYEVLGLDNTDQVLTANAVRCRLDTLIRDIVARRKDEPSVSLRTLEKRLWFSRVLDESHCEKAIVLIGELKEATRNIESDGFESWTAPPLTHPAWERALSLAATKVELSGRSPEDLLYRDHRITAVAAAGRRLREAGYTIIAVKDRIDLAPACERRLLFDLDRLAKNIGGLRLAELLFNELLPHWDSAQMRHHIVRKVSSTGLGQAKPQVPYGLLFNFAAKHSAAHEDAGDTNEAYLQLRELATSFAAIYDTQPYVTFDGMFADRESIVSYLQKVAAFDSLFVLPQAHPLHAGRKLRGLLHPFADSIIRAWGLALEEIASVVDAIMAPEETGPLLFSVESIAGQIGMTHNRAESVLNLLTHDVQPNTKFIDPIRIDEADFADFPLIRHGRDFLLLDRSTCAGSVLDGMLSRLRQYGEPLLNERVGHAFEQFVHSEFSRYGIPGLKGEYVSSEGRRECDLIVETTDAIVLVELKKKGLTRNARSARSDAIILDLSNAMLLPHVQTGRHEISLLTDGHLSLELEGEIRHISLASRTIERVAVTLPEFGAFHSRDVTGKVLNLFTGSHIDSADISKKDLKTINTICQKLSQVYSRAVALGVDHPERFVNCWFLGLEALFTLLDNVHDPDTFWKELKRTRHLTTGSLNWHYDYKFARTLKTEMAEQVSRIGSTFVLAP